MSNGVNRDYYLRREAQERAIAARAVDQAAKRLHLDLASRYADRLRELGEPVN